jgi:fatty-acyl-CoA synthase
MLGENPDMSDTFALSPATPLRLDHVVLRHALERPLAAALSQDGHTLNYAELAQQVAHASQGLLERGVRQGDRVACLSFNTWEMLVLLLALARTGAMLAPLNYRLAAAEWDQLMGDCRPRLLLHDPGWHDQARELSERHGVPVCLLSQLCVPVGQADDHTAARAKEDVAGDLCHASIAERWRAGEAGDTRPLLLVYTSGTTGTPRAAVHTQANLLANMQAASAAMSMSASDRVLTVLPLFHVGGLCIQTLPALGEGAHVTLQARFDPQTMLHALVQERISMTVVVPAVMKALIERPEWPQTDLSALRCVMAGSSHLPQSLVRAFLDRGVPLGNVYGATETGPFSIALVAEPARMVTGACGWPVPRVQARLGPLDGADVNTGEVWLRGPAVVQHYWPDQPALDAQGWFRSGDVAHVDETGCWTIVGRSKDMIISGGENIYPAEIETLLAQHPAVAECTVIGMPDARWGERVVAVVVVRDTEPASDDELLALVRERLARYKHPREVVRMSVLPKTALGKVQKAVLKERLSAP